MSAITLVCPHCTSTGTYRVGSKNGNSPVQCRRCHERFRVYMRNGDVYEVREV